MKWNSIIEVSIKLGVSCTAAMALLVGSDSAKDLNGGKAVVTCTSTSIEGLFHQMIPILGLREGDRGDCEGDGVRLPVAAHFVWLRRVVRSQEAGAGYA